MTVEAALILPLLLFFFLNLFTAFDMIRLHGRLQTAVWETGRQMAVSGYAYDRVRGEDDRAGLFEDTGTALVSELALQSGVVHYLGEDYLEESPLTGGASGLRFSGSRLLTSDDCIDIRVAYEVSPRISLAAFRPFRMSNRYYARAWTGYELEAESGDGDYVYVTEYGTVYHERISCSYLRRTVEEVPLSEISGRRNESGGRYGECELCGQGEGGTGTVYITPDGGKYHRSLSCPALHRRIFTILRTEAQGRYAPCSRCAGG